MPRTRSLCTGLAVILAAVLLAGPSWAKLTDLFPNSIESAKRWVEARNPAQLSFSGGQMHLINQVGHGGITYERDSARMWAPITIRIRAKSAATQEGAHKGGVLAFALAERKSLTDPLADQYASNGPCPKDGLYIDISFRESHGWNVVKMESSVPVESETFGPDMTTWDAWQDIVIRVFDNRILIWHGTTLLKRTNWSIPMDVERRIWLGVGYAQIDIDYIKVIGRDGIMEELVEPAGPVVVSAAAVPTRSGATQIAVNLSTAASVGVEIRNIAGRSVAVLPERALAAGVSSLSWNGRAASGTAVPPGRYTATVIARATDGSLARCLISLQR